MLPSSGSLTNIDWFRGNTVPVGRAAKFGVAPDAVSGALPPRLAGVGAPILGSAKAASVRGPLLVAVAGDVGAEGANGLPLLPPPEQPAVRTATRIATSRSMGKP